MTVALGVDVGGTSARLVVVVREPGGSVRALGPAQKVAWYDAANAPTPERLAAVIADLAARAGVTIVPDLPVGLGFAAQLSPDGRRVLNAPNLGWRDVALADRLADALAVRRSGVRVLNDLKAILAGELAFGAARGGQNVLAVYAGTGVGGAFAIDGAIVAGDGGTAGEIGHVKLLGRSEPCGCGEVGCLEAVAGGAAILRRLVAEVEAGRLVGRPDGSPLTIADVDARAAAGDPTASALLDELADVLGHAIGGAMTLLNPEMLILGGGVLDHAPQLRARVERRALALTLTVARDRVRIAVGSLGDDAGALGAGSAALRG